MRRIWRGAVLAALGLVLLLGLVDLLVTTDEEAIDARVEALVQALEDRDAGALEPVLAPSFRSTPAELRAASPREFLQRVRRWLEDVEALAIDVDAASRRLEIAGDGATLELQGSVGVRLRWGAAAFEFRTTSEWQKDEAGGWRVTELRALSLRNGAGGRAAP